MLASKQKIDEVVSQRVAVAALCQKNINAVYMTTVVPSLASKWPQIDKPSQLLTTCDHYG